MATAKIATTFCSKTGPRDVRCEMGAVKRRRLLCCVGCILVLAGCGSSSEDQTSSVLTPVPTTAPLDGDGSQASALPTPITLETVFLVELRVLVDIERLGAPPGAGVTQAIYPSTAKVGEP